MESASIELKANTAPIHNASSEPYATKTSQCNYDHFPDLQESKQADLSDVNPDITFQKLTALLVASDPDFTWDDFRYDTFASYAEWLEMNASGRFDGEHDSTEAAAAAAARVGTSDLMMKAVVEERVNLLAENILKAHWKSQRVRAVSRGPPGSTTSDGVDGNLNDDRRPRVCFDIADALRINLKESSTADMPDVHHKQYQIDWRHITYTVQGGERVLRGISGQARPGRLLAVMGPSGSGKSSLLNILAYRLRGFANTTVSGTLLINGREMSQTEFSKKAAYVMQAVTILETTTPREAILFSARSRLPRSVSDEQKMKRVDRLIEALQLGSCQHTRVGGENGRGLSGGELKRVALAIELVTNPMILLCDEPTSGLDSHSATAEVRLLKKLALSGRTVILTIHQPNSFIFELFDDLLMIKGGETVYMGPAKEAVACFERLSDTVCDDRIDRIDYLENFLRVDDRNSRRRERVVPYVQYYQPESERSYNDSSCTFVAQEDTAEIKCQNGLPSESSARHCLREISLLMCRTLRHQVRKSASVQYFVGKALLISSIVGIAFFDIGYSASAVPSRLGLLFFSLLHVATVTLMNVVLTFPLERAMFVQEHANGMYSTFSYYVTKALCELPIVIAYNLCYISIAYPIVGFGPAWDQVLRFSIVMVMTSFAAYAIGVVVGCFADDVKEAVLIAPMVMIFAALFSGFFQSTLDMNISIMWISYLSWFKYAFDAAVINEFGSNFNVDGCNAISQRCPYSNGDEIIDFYGLGDLNFWTSFGILAAFTALFLAMGYSVLLWQTTKHTVRPIAPPEDVESCNDDHSGNGDHVGDGKHPKDNNRSNNDLREIRGAAIATIGPRQQRPHDAKVHFNDDHWGNDDRHGNDDHHVNDERTFLCAEKVNSMNASIGTGDRDHAHE